ncbi:unnamed protein product, partial [Symbiodinium sp. KB8]
VWHFHLGAEPWEAWKISADGAASASTAGEPLPSKECEQGPQPTLGTGLLDSCHQCGRLAGWLCCGSPSCTTKQEGLGGGLVVAALCGS